MTSKTYLLSELISDCSGLFSMKGSVAKVTFSSPRNARRFMSLVNQVDPPHQGCSMSYHGSYAIAEIELSPGQFAKQEPDTNFLFLGEIADAKIAGAVIGSVRMFISGAGSATIYDAKGNVVMESNPSREPASAIVITRG